MNYSIFPLKKKFLLCRPFHSDLSRNSVYNSHFSSPTASIYQNKLHCTPSRGIFSRRKDTFLLYLLIVAIFFHGFVKFPQKKYLSVFHAKNKAFSCIVIDRENSFRRKFFRLSTLYLLNSVQVP